ncbi:unnamed protein product [Nezara viridula]|uniref:Uncharacterized protein n=1 Tax=Nezara viridula TaxID=85310 RepID=A0A9P0HGW6_NEZVI|nr:unnamed protein product [Nezara viridula]
MLCVVKNPFKKLLPNLFAQKNQVQYVLKRHLNVHEYISYKLLQEVELPVPKHGIADQKDQIKKLAQDLGTNDIVLKAQVLTGGRGKGTFKNGMQGGVKLVNSVDEAVQIGSKMLGEVLVTKQTGEKGLLCKKLMVAERKKSKKEFYICIMMERSFDGPVMMASAEGGVEIEEVAAKNPKAIHYFPIDIYKVFCLDAKLRFDDSAKYRQKKLFEYRDVTQEDPKDVAAGDLGLNYVALDGTIGCMVNGAGLAMATCDIIKLHGGNPANFLDVGGGSQTEQIKEGFRIILSHEKVKGVLVNIFGGINRCDIIANGIVLALKGSKLNVPVVIRLQGTNVKQGKEVLESTKLPLKSIDDLEAAAEAIVRLTR